MFHLPPMSLDIRDKQGQLRTFSTKAEYIRVETVTIRDSQGHQRPKEY